MEEHVAVAVGEDVEVGSAEHVHKSKETSMRFLGRWNRLVSRTNWEKGRIICQWREALIADGSTPAEFSDDAWAQQAGGISAGHVGRLRRVWQRYGEVREEYNGLYWSHFMATLDWNDAEMWLEGALQNGWSVSQMRGKRWEAMGAPGNLRPSDEEILETEIPGEGAIGAVFDAVPSATAAAVRNVNAGTENGVVEETNGSPHEVADVAPAARPPFAELPELPQDVAAAFEHFKLAIVNHKLAGWQTVSRQDVLACLDSLKELALAAS